MKNKILILMTILITFTSCNKIARIGDSEISAIRDQTEVLQQQNELIKQQNVILLKIANKK